MGGRRCVRNGGDEEAWEPREKALKERCVPAPTFLPATLVHPQGHRTHSTLAWSSGSAWLSGKNAGSDLTLPLSLTQSKGRQCLPHGVIPRSSAKAAQSPIRNREDTRETLASMAILTQSSPSQILMQGPGKQRAAPLLHCYHCCHQSHGTSSEQVIYIPGPEFPHL